MTTPATTAYSGPTVLTGISYSKWYLSVLLHFDWTSAFVRRILITTYPSLENEEVLRSNGGQQKHHYHLSAGSDRPHDPALSTGPQSQKDTY